MPAGAPRLLRPARWLFRLVDARPTAPSRRRRRASTRSTRSHGQPGRRLPAARPPRRGLEVFDVDGTPVGELLHDAIGGGVVWEIAPGAAGPADAGPLLRPAPARSARSAGFAAGLVAADVTARGGRRSRDRPESARCRRCCAPIDTTLWTVDTFASLGSEHVAGLVGRPIAVVRAQLRLELDDDPTTARPLRPGARRGVRRRPSARSPTDAFPVRIGELTRSDDGVLGFFVDDDYTRFRLVDKVGARRRTGAGRSRGQLGLLGRRRRARRPDRPPVPRRPRTTAAPSTSARR